MKQILRNEYFIGYSALYLVTLILMALIEHFPVSQSVAMLLVVGVFFTLVAYLTSKSSIQLFADTTVQKKEGLVLSLLLVFILLILSIGDNQIKSFFSFWLSESPIANEIFTLFYRLLIFVAIPFLVYKFIYKFSLHDFGLVVKVKEFFTIKNFLILLVMAIVILLFQFFLGNGASPIRAGLISDRQLFIGLPLLYLFLIFRVGLVEEFFFRGLVQSRLAAITKSEIGGIILSGLFFGLAHAPGFYLRGGGTLDNLGLHPSFFMSVGYSILILSVGGFFLSVIWSKTRNLWLVMAIHACVDLLPGLQEFVKTWGIN